MARAEPDHPDAPDEPQEEAPDGYWDVGAPEPLTEMRRDWVSDVANAPRMPRIVRRSVRLGSIFDALGALRTYGTVPRRSVARSYLLLGIAFDGMG